MSGTKENKQKIQPAVVEKTIRELRKLGFEMKPAERFPRLFDCYRALAFAHMRANEPRAAFEAVEQALLFTEVDAQVFFEAGIIALEARQWSAAGKYYYRTLNYFSEDDLVRPMLAPLWELKLDFTKADPWLQQFLARVAYTHPKTLSKPFLRDLAKALRCDSDPVDVAQALAEEAFSREPTTVYHHVLQAEIAKKKGDTKRELAAMRGAFAAEPSPYREAQLRVREAAEGKKPPQGIVAKYPGALSYYNAGVLYGDLRHQFVRDSAEREQAEKLAVQAYDEAIARFERHFASLQGTDEDGSLHVYSMACRNRAMIEMRKQNYEGCISLHTRGIETSPFFEHYNERSLCYYHLKQMARAGEDSKVLLSEYGEMLDPAHTVIHHYRVILGAQESGDLPGAAKAARGVLDYVGELSPKVRQSLQSQIATISELCARIFDQVGDREEAKRLEKFFGQRAKGEAEVKKLLTEATELLKRQQYAEALPYFERVNEIKPRNIDALNWRVWILATLRNQVSSTAQKKPLDRRLRGLSEEMLEILTEPSPEWAYAPKNAIVKGYESALSNLAWGIYETSKKEAELYTALTMIEKARSPALNFFRADDLRYLLDTKVRLLLKLGRKSEAFVIVSEVLDTDPQFDDFQEFKNRPEVRSAKAKRREVAGPLPSYTFIGPRRFSPRPLVDQLVAELIEQITTAFHDYRRAQRAHATGDGFVLSIEDLSSARQLLRLKPSARKDALFLCFTREPARIPEYGILDNLQSDQPLHQEALRALVSLLMVQDLDFSEGELLSLLRLQQWIPEVLEGILAQVKRTKKLGPALRKELQTLAPLMEQTENTFITQILANL